MAEKVPVKMVLEADLQCHRCYKKVKKVLSEIPQIRDPEYDEKENKVTIKVVCCCPEKIKQKILCKAGDCVKSIKIEPKEKPTDCTPVPSCPPAPGCPLVLPICVYVWPPAGPCRPPRPPPCSGNCGRPGCDSCGCDGSGDGGCDGSCGGGCGSSSCGSRCSGSCRCSCGGGCGGGCGGSCSCGDSCGGGCGCGCGRCRPCHGSRCEEGPCGVM